MRVPVTGLGKMSIFRRRYRLPELASRTANNERKIHVAEDGKRGKKTATTTLGWFFSPLSRYDRRRTTPSTSSNHLIKSVSYSAYPFAGSAGVFFRLGELLRSTIWGCYQNMENLQTPAVASAACANHGTRKDKRRKKKRKKKKANLTSATIASF